MSFFSVFKTTNNVGYSIITLPFRLSRRLLLASSSLYLKNNRKFTLDFNTSKGIMYIYCGGKKVKGFLAFLMFFR